jgi:hypothetical protein
VYRTNVHADGIFFILFYFIFRVHVYRTNVHADGIFYFLFIFYFKKRKKFHVCMDRSSVRADALTRSYRWEF